ncbi:hypothetical protein MMC18_004536 [Xylographa bjoerkii]|nr:hypothetical protein [Xylographa bjoerkii]
MSLQQLQDQIANMQSHAANLQEALASRVEEVTVLRQEVTIAVEQRDTLALFLASRRYLLEEDSHDLARDCLAIVDEFLGVPSAAPAPAPTTPIAARSPGSSSYRPAANATNSTGSSFYRSAPYYHRHHHNHRELVPPPAPSPPNALSPAPAPSCAVSPAPTAPSSAPLLAENDYHMVVYGFPLRPRSHSAPAYYGTLVVATTGSATISLASSPPPLTPTPPPAQHLATSITTAATEGTTASERAAWSAELRGLGEMARNMEEGSEEAEMRDRGSPLPRHRAERNWVRVGGVRRGGVWRRGVDVQVLPPPRIVWPDA